MDLLTKQDFEFKRSLIEVLSELEAIDDDSFIKMLEGNHIFELMYLMKASFPSKENVFTLWYDRYVEMFKFFFKEDVFHKIKSVDDFEFYRDLILESNGVDFEKPNPNPEIQRPKDAWNAIQKMKGEIPSFEDMVSTVSLFYGGDISEITLYQLKAFFEKAIGYSSWTATLVGKMFSPDMKIDNWFVTKKVEKKELTIDEDEVKGFQIHDLSDKNLQKENEE